LNFRSNFEKAICELIDDFGKIKINSPEWRRTILMPLITWAYSIDVFVLALQSEMTAAILHDTITGFKCFCWVLRELY